MILCTKALDSEQKFDSVNSQAVNQEDVKDKDQKTNYKEQRKQKRLASELAALKTKEKLIFEDDFIAIYGNRYGMTWLSPF